MRRCALALTLLVTLLAPAVAPSPARAVPPRAGGSGSGGGSSAGGSSTGGSVEGTGWQPLFEEGRRAHDEGRFEEAASAFRRAHDAGGPPSLLYNYALCLDRLGRYEDALIAYHAYLQEVPTAANRADVEARMAALEPADIESGGSGLATTIAPPTGPVMQILPPEGGFEMVVVGQGRPVTHTGPTGPQVEEIGPEWVVSWFFLLGTLGSAGAAIGVWIDGQSTFDLLREDCAAVGGCAESDIAASSAHTSATVTNVLLVTTAVLGVATAISFLVEGTSTGGTRVYVDLGPGSLGLRGSF